MSGLLRCLGGMLACIALMNSQAHAAKITRGHTPWGLPAIHVIGQIMPGDDQVFAAQAATTPSNGVVVLGSPGGNLATALHIAEIIREKGFSTVVGRLFGPCASACALIWLSGGHAIVQRNSALGFHMASDATGAPSPDATAKIASYLRSLGLTEGWIDYMTSAAPQEMQWATERDARALGFRPQVIFDIGATLSCKSKYCLAIP